MVQSAFIAAVQSPRLLYVVALQLSRGKMSGLHIKLLVDPQQTFFTHWLNEKPTNL